MCRSLLNRIDQSDSKQLKLVFDSMDKNSDGQLSREELEEFAIELGYVPSTNSTHLYEMLFLLFDKLTP